MSRRDRMNKLRSTVQRKAQDAIRAGYGLPKPTFELSIPWWQEIDPNILNLMCGPPGLGITFNVQLGECNHA